MYVLSVVVVFFFFQKQVSMRNRIEEYGLLFLKNCDRGRDYHDRDSATVVDSHPSQAHQPERPLLRYLHEAIPGLVQVPRPGGWVRYSMEKVSHRFCSSKSEFQYKLEV